MLHTIFINPNTIVQHVGFIEISPSDTRVVSKYALLGAILCLAYFFSVLDFSAVFVSFSILQYTNHQKGIIFTSHFQDLYRFVNNINYNDHEKYKLNKILPESFDTKQ